MANTIAQVIAYAKAHPKRDGASWSGWCESFIWRAGGFNGSFNNALLAGNASGPLRSDWAAAPAGAIHYWAGVGGDGHVAFSLGGGILLMASSQVSNYGTALGTIHFSNYALPLYRGWTMRHGVETLSGASTAATVSAPVADWKAWQTLLKGWGYTGAVDGIPGVNTYKALQEFLSKKFAYAGAIDGLPGALTWAAFGRATAAGYPDFVPAPAGVDWKAWQTLLKGWGYGGAVDGDPGINTYKALQTFLKEKAGYAGTVDGIPGNQTWTAFARAVSAGYPVLPAPAPALVVPAPVVVAPPVVVVVTPVVKTGSFGIDVATSQRTLDLAAAKKEGVEFVIVKMGGLNVTPQYVAPYYTAQVDAARALSLPVGHYYLVGAGQTPEAQAAYFVKNLHKFDVNRDVLALDNERLDGNAALFTDLEAARFMAEVIKLTGIPASRIWLYAGAGDFRAHGPWAASQKLGVRIWWAAYGGYPIGHTPDHEPSLQGSVTKWDIHQFSSKVAVAGFSVDGNYSRLLVEELFAKGVVTPVGEAPAVAPVVVAPAVVVPPAPTVPVVTDPVLTAGSRSWMIAALTGIVSTLTALIVVLTNLK